VAGVASPGLVTVWASGRRTSSRFSARAV
jgi:hypothetical protein